MASYQWNPYSFQCAQRVVRVQGTPSAPHHIDEVTEQPAYARTSETDVTSEPRFAYPIPQLSEVPNSNAVSPPPQSYGDYDAPAATQPVAPFAHENVRYGIMSAPIEWISQYTAVDAWDGVTPKTRMFLGQLPFKIQPHQIINFLRIYCGAAHVYDVRIRNGAPVVNPNVTSEPKGCAFVEVDSADVMKLKTMVHEQFMFTSTWLFQGPSTQLDKYHEDHALRSPWPVVCQLQGEQERQKKVRRAPFANPPQYTQYAQAW